MKTPPPLSSCQLDEAPTDAMDGASKDPVVSEEPATPSRELITDDHGRALPTQSESIIELLAMPGAADIDFEAARCGIAIKPAELE